MLVMIIDEDEQRDLDAIRFIRKLQLNGWTVSISFGGNRWVEATCVSDKTDAKFSPPPCRVLGDVINELKKELYDSRLLREMKGERIEVSAK